MKVLCLRTCDENRRSHGGFQWPESGPVEAPDWEPTKECGHGLHGNLWGGGDAGLLTMNGKPGSRLWLVVEVESDDMIDLNGKVKFPRCEVLYCGCREVATRMVADRAPQGFACHFLVAEGGDYSTLTGGDGSTLTGGNRSILIWRVWDDSRYRIHVRYVGEDGIKPNTPYRFEDGEVVEARQEESE